LKTEKILKEINKKKYNNLYGKIVIIIYLIFIIFFICRANGQEYLISDYEFTNQNYTMQGVYKFCKSFKNNPLSYDDVEIIVRYCHLYTINPLPILIKMQMESDLLERNLTNKTVRYLKIRAMGYGMAHNFRLGGLKHYEYGGYQIQIFHAIKRMREFLEEWEPGMKKYVIDLKKDIIPANASSYALYRYTPFYGKHNEYNWKYDAIGNMAFSSLFRKYKMGWDITMHEESQK